MTRSTTPSPRAHPGRTLRLIVVAVAGLALLGTACGEDESDVPTPASVGAPAATDEAATDGAGTSSEDELGDPSGGTVDTNPLSTGNTPDNTAEGTVP